MKILSSAVLMIISINCVVLSESKSAAQWPTFHGDQALTGTTMLTLPAAPKELWRAKIGTTLTVPPIVGGERVYVCGSKGPLAAFSMDGKQIWSTVLNDKSTFAAPAIYVNDRIIIGSDEGILYAVDAATGKVAWQYDTNDTIQGGPNWTGTSPAIRIIVVSQSIGSIHCIDLTSGKLLWKIDNTSRCDGSPAVDNGQLVFGNCDAAIYTFSIDSGKQTGKTDLGPEGQVAGGIAVSDNHAFTGTHGGAIVCVDILSQKTLWTFNDTDSSVYSTPAVNMEYIVFASDSGTLYCLDRKTGKFLWKTKTGSTPKSPIIAGSNIILPADGTLYIYSLKDGKLVWSQEISDEITSCAIAGGMIIVGSDDGYLWAFGEKAAQ